MPNLYSIYDNKAQTFNKPFVMKTDGMAIRAFQAEVNEQGSDFNRWPNDFSLFRVGSFCEDEGVVSAPLSSDKDGNEVPVPNVQLGLASQYLELNTEETSQD